MKPIVWKLTLMGLLLGLAPWRVHAQTSFDVDAAQIEEHVADICKVRDCSKVVEAEDQNPPTLTGQVVVDTDRFHLAKVAEPAQDETHVGVIDRGDLVKQIPPRILQVPTQEAPEPRTEAPSTVAGNSEVAEEGASEPAVAVNGAGCTLSTVGSPSEMFGEAGLISLIFGFAPLAFVLRKKR